MIRRCCLATLAALTTAVVLGGCVKLAQPGPHVQTYALVYTASTPRGRHLPVTLRVAPFGVAALYDRESIVYRETAITTGTYFYHRWGANPGHMVADLLARDLADSGAYDAVHRTPVIGGADYELTGDVETLEEAPAAHGCVAALRLRITLSRTRAPAGGTVVSQKAYAAEQPCVCADVPTLVEAMSHALATVSDEVGADVYHAIARDTARR